MLTKTLLATLSLASISFAASADDARAVKSWDGRVAICASIADANVPAYVPTKVSATTDGESLYVDMSIESVICRWNGRRGSWVSHSFNAPIPVTTFDLSKATLRWIHQEFLMVNPSQKVLGSIQTSRGSTQQLAYAIPLQSALSPADLEALRSSGTATVDLEFFLLGRAEVQTETSVVQMSQSAWGSYFVTVTLQSSADGTLSTSTRLR